ARDVRDGPDRLAVPPGEEDAAEPVGRASELADEELEELRAAALRAQPRRRDLGEATKDLGRAGPIHPRLDHLDARARGAVDLVAELHEPRAGEREAPELERVREPELVHPEAS